MFFSVFALLSMTAIGQHTLYCPSTDDLTIAYDSLPSGAAPKLMNQGWITSQGGGVATKAAYNLLGGYVEFDIDLSKVHPGVNANIYTISPKSFPSNGFNISNYCDGAATGDKWCIEIDWLESNGDCGGATTLHTIEGPGYPGCTAWGCRQEYHYNGKSSFHMRVEHGADGSWTTIRDGNTIGPNDLAPPASDSDWAIIKSVMSSYGAVIYSSQWTGWVPVDDCGTTPGDLSTSTYAVSNLKVYGTVMQGPRPTTC